MRDVKKMRLGALGCFLAAGLVLAACGGGTSHAAASTNGTTTTTAGGNGNGDGNGGGRGAALVAFRDCMSSHGVTLPTRPRTGNGVPPSTTPGETRPQGVGDGAGPGGFPGFGGGNLADRFNTPPVGVDATKYKAALAACKSKIPTRGANPLNNSAFLAYRSCLKDHGVTLPTLGGSGGGGSFNRNDPKVKAALATCRPLLPAGGFGRSTTTTTIKPA
jgi:hypothetical protein